VITEKNGLFDGSSHVTSAKRPPGLSDLRLHDLRGEAGSPLLEAGVPIHEVRDALGHSSTTMTSTSLRTRVNSLTKAYQQRAAYQARQRMKAVR
jgi:integrase